MKKVNVLILLSTFFLLIRNNFSGQEAVKIKRITGHIEFDGIPEEEAWKVLDNFKLVQYRPYFSTDPMDYYSIPLFLKSYKKLLAL